MGARDFYGYLSDSFSVNWNMMRRLNNYTIYIYIYSKYMQKYYIAVHYRYCYSKTIHIIYPNTHWTVMGMSNTHICVLYSIFLEQSMEIWRSRKPWPQYPKVWLRNSNIMARRRVFLLYQRATVSQISNRYFLSNCVNVTRLIYLTKSNGLLLKWLHFNQHGKLHFSVYITTIWLMVGLLLLMLKTHQ